MGILVHFLKPRSKNRMIVIKCPAPTSPNKSTSLRQEEKVQANPSYKNGTLNLTAVKVEKNLD